MSILSSKYGSFGAALLGIALVGAFGWHVAQYYFVSDDAYISFRYAQNLIEGHGLVYNPGERVEGYTNLLWVLMAAAVLAAGFSPEIWANITGILSGAGILLALLWLGARSSRWSDPLIWIAPGCLALNRTFAAWSTGGLETQFFTMLVLFAYVAYLVERENGRVRPVGSAALFAAAMLTRPEGALFAGVAGAFFVWDTFVARRRPARDLVLWAGLLGLVAGCHVAWRYSYYGYLLPNTFYAKVSGFWWEQSRVWFGLFLRDYWVLWAAPLLLVVLALRRSFENGLFAVATVGYCGYLLYIGGDNFEFRFMAPILPYLYWLLQEGVRGLVGWPGARGWGISIGRAAGLVAAVLLLLGSHAAHRTGFEGMEHGIIDLERFKEYTDSRAEQGRFLRRLVEDGYLRGDEVISVGGAGALPYFSRLPTVDFRGLTDAHVAHLPAQGPRWIAHEKAAPYAYLAERGVVMWDVKNRIVWPAGFPRPRPHGVKRAFFSGPVSCVKAHGRYLMFATTLTEDDFRRVFSRFEIVFYGRTTG